MPVFTLKTPQDPNPKELLSFLQELTQYLKYITEHLDEDNVPKLKDLAAGQRQLEAEIAKIKDLQRKEE